MKRILILSALFLAAAAASAQTATLPSNLYAAGASYNSGASPQIAGTGLYARLVTSTDATTGVVTNTGTYAFTAIDVLPISVSPFTVSTNIGVGVAQKVLEVNGIRFFMPTSAGISITGTNTGWSWTGGILADYNFKKSGAATKYHLMPNVRFLKSSVSNGSDYQLIGGLMFGFGS